MTGETCDTSVLVAAVLSWHPDHVAAHRAVSTRVSAIPAHVLIETYSVLTRLPAPHRLDPATAAEAIGAIQLRVVALPGTQHRQLIVGLAGYGIRGGAVYDALVARTAIHHDLTLLTRDRRARPTYDAIGATYIVL